MEKFDVVPLSAVPPTLLIDYLGRRGIAEPIVRWKYFDAGYNRGRERGVCAVSEGKIIGFIGLIPITLQRGAEVRDDNWLCDWSVRDPVRDKGVGGAVAARALEIGGKLIAYGGTEMAKKRWALKSNGYDLHAALTFRKHIRIGSYLAGLQRRRLLPRNKLTRLVGRIAIQPVRTAPRGVTAYKGVDPGIVKLFKPGGTHWKPIYDLADLRWNLESCPAVEAWTFVGAVASAAVLVWRSTAETDIWKLVTVGDVQALRPCLDAALEHVWREGGETVLMVVSRVDTDVIAGIREARFKQAPTIQPIYFLDKASVIPDTLAGISFLAADGGHRF